MGQELDLLKARRDRVEEQLDAATDGALEARLLLEYEHLEKEVQEMELKELAQVGRGLPANEDLSKLTDEGLIAQSDELVAAGKGFAHLLSQQGGLSRQEKDEQDATAAKLRARANALQAEASRRNPASLRDWDSEVDLAEKLMTASQTADYPNVEKYHKALKSIVDSMGGKP